MCRTSASASVDKAFGRDMPTHFEDTYAAPTQHVSHHSRWMGINTRALHRDDPAAMFQATAHILERSEKVSTNDVDSPFGTVENDSNVPVGHLCPAEYTPFWGRSANHQDILLTHYFVHTVWLAV